MALRLKDGQTILFIGDSITDCGRRDERFRPLGQGYVTLFRDLSTIREPQKKLTVINTGIGGNTAEDLRNRWFDDALTHKPDWLSVKIGINDCHRWVSDPANKEQSPVRFKEILDELLGLTKQELPGVKLLLIDPFLCSNDLDGKLPNSHRSRVYKALPEYLDAVHAMAKKYKTRHVPTHELFHAQFKHQPMNTYFANEPVHPNATGHLLIAEAVYKALSE